jgi:Fuc2NAc and GlcNAc transferase
VESRFLILLPACALMTAVGVGFVRRIALARGIVDLPNARSSHARAVPRGGGLIVALVASLALAALAATGVVSQRLAVALLVAGLVVAGAGWLDDLRGLAPLARICVHVAAAAAALALIGGWGPSWLSPGSGAWWLLQAATVLGIVWSINLYNFMDGIDGIAGAEAVFLGASGYLMMSGAGVDPGVEAAALVMASTALGFLAWNWAPAKIFMGDVGSGYLGFVFAVLAVASAHQDPSLIVPWLILSGSFFVDAIVTLARRLIRRERFYEAHRIHAYQWLARRFGSHSPVTLLYSAVNVLWLLPMAWLSLHLPQFAHWIAIAALGPLVAGALVAGAGRPEARAAP